MTATRHMHRWQSRIRQLSTLRESLTAQLALIGPGRSQRGRLGKLLAHVEHTLGLLEGHQARVADRRRGEPQPRVIPLRDRASLEAALKAEAAPACAPSTNFSLALPLSMRGRWEESRRDYDVIWPRRERAS